MTRKPAQTGGNGVGRVPTTPDGRYIVVRGRLWRAANPALPAEEHAAAVAALMQARRDVASANRASDPAALADARARVDAAKHRLGERGPVWWTDGAPDLNRHMAHTTPYAGWFAEQSANIDVERAKEIDDDR